MHLNLSKIKSIGICLLIILALYQTNLLWFENSSNHNFFYNFLKEPRLEDKELMEGFNRPYRIAASFSDNKQSLYYSKIEENELFNIGYESVKLVLSEGDFAGMSKKRYLEFSSLRAIIFEYSFLMPPEVFIATTGQKSNMHTAKMKEFDAIAIVPDTENSEKLKVYFVNKSEGTSIEYNLENINLCDRIKRALQSSEREMREDGFSYSYFEMEENRGIYVPEWVGNEHAYINLDINVDYYSKDRGILMADIGEKVDVFFENPSMKINDTLDNNVLAFSDVNTVVKYYSNDILEYTNYKKQSSNKETTLLQDYSSAVKFIEKDSLNLNEYYLHSYKENGEERGVRYFYFDFVCNNFPIVLKYSELFSEDISEESDAYKDIGDIREMAHGIEISVKNGVVTKYKKLCYRFSQSDKSPYSLTTRLTDMELHPEDIKDITLGYYINERYNWMDSEPKKVRLFYIIEPIDDGNVFVQSAGYDSTEDE